jgi:molybdopterin-binding protein
VLRPSDLVLSRTASAGPAPRNRFPARITRIEPGPAVAWVHLDAGGTDLVAAVTAGTAEELALAAGGEVVVSIKATAVHLI